MTLACTFIVAQAVFPQEQSAEKKAEKATVTEKAGEVERAALGKLEYMIGNWEGDGWMLSDSGSRLTFWVKEYYLYRGDKDLMDMEGRFGGILPDGTRLPESDYALGLMFYDSKSREYRMWHYGNGRVFTVAVNTNLESRKSFYILKNARGEQSRFSFAIDKEGVWTSKREILKPDSTWFLNMEFSMKRVK